MLIPKVDGGFRGIVLVKVLWKAFWGVINQRIGAAVRFHDVLHSFWAGQGAGTAVLEAKFLRQLAEIMDEVLYEVFLDLWDACDLLDREQYMEILVGFRVGPRMERILRNYWDHLSMVARVGRYCGTLFKGHRGVTQCDPLSPTIFDMVFDVVIHHWVTLVAEEER